MQIKTKTMKLSLAGFATVASLVLPLVANADSYTVKSGDTLSEIAATYNTTTNELASKNNISDVNFISIGQILEIGDKKASTTTTESATSAATSTTTETVNYSSSVSGSDAAAKEIIAQRESSGSYTAQNGQYYGRYQLTLSYLNGDLSAENQEKVADAYVAGRYGSWSGALAFWNANGWY